MMHSASGQSGVMNSIRVNTKLNRPANVADSFYNIYDVVTGVAVSKRVTDARLFGHLEDTTRAVKCFVATIRMQDESCCLHNAYV